MALVPTISASVALGVIGFISAALGLRALFLTAFFATFLVATFFGAAFFAATFFTGAFLAAFLAGAFLAAFFAIAVAINSLHAESLRWAERKSVGEGKSVEVRVDIGGRRIIKKKM